MEDISANRVFSSKVSKRSKLALEASLRQRQSTVASSPSRVDSLEFLDTLPRENDFLELSKDFQLFQEENSKSFPSLFSRQSGTVIIGSQPEKKSLFSSVMKDSSNFDVSKKLSNTQLNSSSNSLIQSKASFSLSDNIKQCKTVEASNSSSTFKSTNKCNNENMNPNICDKLDIDMKNNQHEDNNHSNMNEIDQMFAHHDINIHDLSTSFHEFADNDDDMNEILDSACFQIYGARVTSTVMTKDGSISIVGFSDSSIRIYDLTISGTSDYEDRYGHYFDSLQSRLSSAGFFATHLEIAEHKNCCHIFAGVSTGCQRMVIIDVNTIRHMKSTHGFITKNGYGIQTFEINDPKIRGFCALTTLSVTTPDKQNSNFSHDVDEFQLRPYTAVYRLFCGKAFGQFCIWEVTLTATCRVIDPHTRHRTEYTIGSSTLEYHHSSVLIAQGRVTSNMFDFGCFVTSTVTDAYQSLKYWGASEDVLTVYTNTEDSIRGENILSCFDDMDTDSHMYWSATASNILSPFKNTNTLLNSQVITTSNAANKTSSLPIVRPFSVSSDKKISDYEIIFLPRTKDVRVSLVKHPLINTSECNTNPITPYSAKSKVLTGCSQYPTLSSIHCTSKDGTILFTGIDELVVCKYIPSVLQPGEDIHESHIGEIVAYECYDINDIVTHYESNTLSNDGSTSVSTGTTTNKRTRHLRQILSIACTEDGSYAMITCSDRSVILYSVCDVFGYGSSAYKTYCRPNIHVSTQSSSRLHMDSREDTNTNLHSRSQHSTRTGTVSSSMSPECMQNGYVTVLLQVLDEISFDINLSYKEQAKKTNTCVHTWNQSNVLHRQCACMSKYTTSSHITNDLNAKDVYNDHSKTDMEDMRRTIRPHYSPEDVMVIFSWWGYDAPAKGGIIKFTPLAELKRSNHSTSNTLNKSVSLHQKVTNAAEVSQDSDYKLNMITSEVIISPTFGLLPFIYNTNTAEVTSISKSSLSLTKSSSNIVCTSNVLRSGSNQAMCLCNNNTTTTIHWNDIDDDDIWKLPSLQEIYESMKVKESTTNRLSTDSALSTHSKGGTATKKTSRRSHDKQILKTTTVIEDNTVINLISDSQVDVDTIDIPPLTSTDECNEADKYSSLKNTEISIDKHSLPSHTTTYTVSPAEESCVISVTNKRKSHDSNNNDGSTSKSLKSSQDTHKISDNHSSHIQSDELSSTSKDAVVQSYSMISDPQQYETTSTPEDTSLGVIEASKISHTNKNVNGSNNKNVQISTIYSSSSSSSSSSILNHPYNQDIYPNTYTNVTDTMPSTSIKHSNNNRTNNEYEDNTNTSTMIDVTTLTTLKQAQDHIVHLQELLHDAQSNSKYYCRQASKQKTKVINIKNRMNAVIKRQEDDNKLHLDHLKRIMASRQANEHILTELWESINSDTVSDTNTTMGIQCGLKDNKNGMATDDITYHSPIRTKKTQGNTSVAMNNNNLDNVKKSLTSSHSQNASNIELSGRLVSTTTSIKTRLQHLKMKLLEEPPLNNLILAPKCVICQQNNATIALSDCGHICLCKHDAEESKVTQNPLLTCPLCMKPCIGYFELKNLN